MNLHSLSDKAFALHQQGKLTQAEELCRQILQVEPSSFAASYLLGIIRFQQGNNMQALALIGAALKTNPDAIDALTIHGLVLQAVRRPEEALTSYDRALAIKPDFAEALNNRGNSLWELRRFDEALASYDSALAAKPDFAEAQNNCGNILRELQRFDEALARYEKALAIEPRNTAVLNNRGNVLRDLGYLERALASYDAALAIEPNNALAWYNRGTALQDLKRFDEALTSYDRALVIRPNYAAALGNRGNLQWTEKRRYEAARQDLEKAVLVDPDHDYLRGDLLHLKMQVADWRDIERDSALVVAGVRAGKRVVRPFAYQAISDSPADLQACSVIYANDLYPPAPAAAVSTHRAHDRIRVGYVSGEFRAQATSYLTAKLYELHDRGVFEIVAFDNGWNDESQMRARLEASFDKFIDISSLSNVAAAAKIRAEEIDILVNLNGYFGRSRMEVFAQRPAPIQVNYLGFPATLGAHYIDYILADRFVIPQDERRYFTEQVVYLPDSYQVNDSNRAFTSVALDRAQNGLPTTGFVFCNFNQGYKLTPATFAVWMRILSQVENSTLWLLEGNPQFSQNLRREAARHGIAGTRLVFSQPVAMEKHLARLPLADLVLDSLPYNAHTTASDALWAGVPLLTCRGGSFPGRVATSLLHAIDLPELVTNSLEDYEALAVKLAGDPVLLNSIRAKLAHNRLTTPLFDTDRFRRHIEAAYTTMWDIHERGENPRSFSVEVVGD